VQSNAPTEKRLKSERVQRNQPPIPTGRRLGESTPAVAHYCDLYRPLSAVFTRPLVMNYTPSIPSSDCTSPLHTPPEPTVYNAANTGTPRNGQPDTAGATSEVIHFTPSQLATMWPRPALPPPPGRTASMPALRERGDSCGPCFSRRRSTRRWWKRWCK